MINSWSNYTDFLLGYSFRMKKIEKVLNTVNTMRLDCSEQNVLILIVYFPWVSWT